MLKLVPDELREASYALGIPKWKTILRVVIPPHFPGDHQRHMLALARVMGETAPVLVLVGYSRSINFDVLDGNMASLPLLIYTELTNPEQLEHCACGRCADSHPAHCALYLLAAFANRFWRGNASESRGANMAKRLDLKDLNIYTALSTPSPTSAWRYRRAV